MIARTIAACLASAMCLSIANAATVTANSTVTRVPSFAVYNDLNTIHMDPAAFTASLAGCCLQWTTNNTAFQNFSSYANVTMSNNIYCSNATETYEFQITASRFNASVYGFHYDCWDVNSNMASAGDQLNVRITLGQQQNATSSTGSSSANASSSTGSAAVNASSSTGVSGNATQPSVTTSSSTGVSGNSTSPNVNVSSSTGVSGNATVASSTGLSGNATGTSSTGVSGNTTASSSTGRASGNATQEVSSSAPAGLSSSSGEGAWLSSSSSGSVVVVSSSASLIVSSSSGVRVNDTTSTGTRGNATSSSSTGKPVDSVSSSSVPASTGNPPNTMAARFEIEITGTTVPENLKTLIRNDLCNVVAQQFNTTFDVVDPFCLVDVGAPVAAARRLLANRVPITFTLLGNITSVVDTTGSNGTPVSSPLAAVNFIKEAIQTGTPILTTATANLGIVVPVQTVVVEDVSAPVESSTGVEAPAPEDDSSSGLSGGAIAGIVIGVIAGVAILSFIGYAAFAGKMCFKGSASVGVAHATTTPVHVKATKDAEVV